MKSPAPPKRIPGKASWEWRQLSHAAPNQEAFREFTDALVLAAEQSPPGEAWKTIVKTYLRPEMCDLRETFVEKILVLTPATPRSATGIRIEVAGSPIRSLDSRAWSQD